jgi:hypothetical protein
LGHMACASDQAVFWLTRLFDLPKAELRRCFQVLSGDN